MCNGTRQLSIVQLANGNIKNGSFELEKLHNCDLIVKNNASCVHATVRAVSISICLKRQLFLMEFETFYGVFADACWFVVLKVTISLSFLRFLQTRRHKCRREFLGSQYKYPSERSQFIFNSRGKRSGIILLLTRNNRTYVKYLHLTSPGGGKLPCSY